MNSARHHRFLINGLLLAAWIPSAWAGITLAAEDAPVDPPWKQPANFSLVREAGVTTVTADMVLRYRSEDQYAANPGFASKGSYALGLYVHRDNTVNAKKNDRGLQVSYSGLLVPDWSNAGPVVSLGYSIKASTGKGLVEVQQFAGPKTQVEKTKNRLTLSLGGYVQPRISGNPKVGEVPSIMFFDGGPSLYLDESRGNGVAGTGRVIGAALKLGFNYAPLGLEPVALVGMTVVPTIRLAAQSQHDLSVSGSREKKTRNLYTLDFNLLFAQPDGTSNKLIPSLQFSRSVGADLLTGRKQTAKTEVTFGLTF
jgi:hypothetical protein